MMIILSGRQQLMMSSSSTSTMIMIMTIASRSSSSLLTSLSTTFSSPSTNKTSLSFASHSYYYKNNFSTTSSALQTNKKSTTKGGDRVVVLGSGWAGFNIALKMKNSKVPLTVISPNNHFVFTPLLPSTAVGTLEFRCIQEPIRSVLSNDNGSAFVHAKARKLDPINKTIQCESVHNDVFDVEYDKLIIAVGVKTNVSI